MLIIYYSFFLILGLIVGSFLNCLIYRLEKRKNFVFGRSFCPKCNHQLSFFDLIPLLSFFLLKGKCRYCSQKISWQYPLVEITTGLLFISIFHFQFSIFNQISFFAFLKLFYYLLIGSFLIAIFVYDLKHYLIPDKIVYPAIIIVFLYQLFKSLEFIIWNFFGIWKLEIENLEPLILSIISAAGAAAFFLLIVLISRGRWMGLGDVKLAFLMGLFLGYPHILLALFFSFFLGAIIGIILVIFKKKTLKSEIPFGPFLVAGTFLAFFFGEKIINFWTNFTIF